MRYKYWAFAISHFTTQSREMVNYFLEFEKISRKKNNIIIKKKFKKKIK